MNNCQKFLMAFRRSAHPADRALEELAAVSGQHPNYTVHTEGGLIDVRAHCKYCARGEALEILASKRETCAE